MLGNVSLREGLYDPSSLGNILPTRPAPIPRPPTGRMFVAPSAARIGTAPAQTSLEEVGSN